MFKILKHAKEYEDNKPRFLEFKKNEIDFLDYQDHLDEFKEYLKLKERFDTYKDIVGNGKRPYFLMYASDIDEEGNIEFSYDFNDLMPQMLRQQGISGITDLEVVEAYLHLVFSQNYFTHMLQNEVASDKEEE